jgi:hypothetical protein
VTETETARVLYERIRRDSNYRLAPYRTVAFVANMMKRDPFAVLNAIGVQRVAYDDKIEGSRQGARTGQG